VRDVFEDFQFVSSATRLDPATSHLETELSLQAHLFNCLSRYQGELTGEGSRFTEPTRTLCLVTFPVHEKPIPWRFVVSLVANASSGNVHMRDVFV
jgi:hypothetical protein